MMMTQELFADQSYALLLGDCIIGRNARQVISLSANLLTRERLTPEKSHEQIMLSKPDDLFCQLRQWQEESPGFWMVYLGYEFYRWCDEALWQTADFSEDSLPTLMLIEFGDVQKNTKNIWKQNDLPATTSPLPATYLDHFTSSLTPKGFLSAVNQIQRHIGRGDIYQANLSLKLEKAMVLDSPLALYQALCQKNPSPFSAFLKTPFGYLVSNSPERLLKLDMNTRWLETRPIAGTRGRGKTDEDDEHIASELLANQKERAEHLMLVDLLRNDLGRVSVAGSVSVSELLTIERYAHVTHLVSNVIGQLRPDQDIWDALRSVFPGGTITGCPKVRSVEILDAVEPVSRGFYTGGVGYMDLATGLVDINILIRSLLLTPLTPDLDGLRYNARVHVGAGIVADSLAPHEYKECLRKAESILGALYDHDIEHRYENQHQA